MARITRQRKKVTILSVDPGLQRTGYAVLEDGGGRITPLEFGCIETQSKMDLPGRLLLIHEYLGRLIRKHAPGVLAIEKQYFPLKLSSNNSLFATNQARGVILLAAAENGLEVAEYSPMNVKIALTGYGRAGKMQVQSMVKRLLSIKEIKGPDDVSDAIAVGLCHLHTAR